MWVQCWQPLKHQALDSTRFSEVKASFFYVWHYVPYTAIVHSVLRALKNLCPFKFWHFFESALTLLLAIGKLLTRFHFSLNHFWEYDRSCGMPPPTPQLARGQWVRTDKRKLRWFNLPVIHFRGSVSALPSSVSLFAHTLTGLVFLA